MACENIKDMKDIKKGNPYRLPSGCQCRVHVIGLAQSVVVIDDLRSYKTCQVAGVMEIFFVPALVSLNRHSIVRLILHKIASWADRLHVRLFRRRGLKIPGSVRLCSLGRLRSSRYRWRRRTAAQESMCSKRPLEGPDKQYSFLLGA